MKINNNTLDVYSRLQRMDCMPIKLAAFITSSPDADKLARCV